ncbi:MAG TPA: hypothetical protein VGM60_02795 [Pseudonocardia sp.]|uniref:hypothetical protein n=1 Tax=Pseudonocardia sp. TaxID=60912 RepID=UPI002F3E3790
MTSGVQDRGMRPNSAGSPDPSAAALCCILVERQPYGLLVTATMNPDVADRSGDRVVRLTQLSEAIELVTDFLATWVERHDEDRPGG